MLWKLKLPTKSTYFSSAAISHSQMLKELFDYSMIVARLIGISIFDENYTIWAKKLMITVVLFFCTLLITFYDVYLFRKDAVRSIFCILVIAACLQSSAKLYTFVFMRENIQELKSRCEKFLTNFNTVKSAAIFENYLMIASHVGLFMLILFLCVSIFIAIFPIIYYVLTGERILQFGIELPLIEWKTSLIGYGLNIAYQIYIFYIFVCGLIVTTFLIVCFLMNGLAQFDIINMLIGDLNELIVTNANGCNDVNIKLMIKLIIEMQIELNEFLDLLQKTFSSYYFIDFGGLVFQNVISIFAIFSINFIPGYLILPATCFQIFVPCLLGSTLISKCDKLYDELYSISWHLLSVSDQKSIMFILGYAKKSKTLFAGIAVVNLSTFVELYKAIYSYTMLLENLK